MRNFRAARNLLEVKSGAICADAPLPANARHIGDKSMPFHKVLFGALALLLLGAGPSVAVEAPALLTISGAIGASNQDGALVLDRGTLEAMKTSVVRTETPWTEGMVTFEGVSLKSLLEFAGAKGEVIHAVALNDYAVDIPVADAANPQVIVAYRMNGEIMRVRDKGPLWLIYPLSDDPALRTEATHNKMIWQIKALEIR